MSNLNNDVSRVRNILQALNENDPSPEIKAAYESAVRLDNAIHFGRVDVTDEVVEAFRRKVPLGAVHLITREMVESILQDSVCILKEDATKELLGVLECHEALDMSSDRAVPILESHGWEYSNRFDMPASNFVRKMRAKALAKYQEVKVDK